MLLPYEMADEVKQNALGATDELLKNGIARTNELYNMLKAPSVIYKPRLSLDGNQWCALLGSNLIEGVAGFGDSPADAMAAFDKAWHEKVGERGEDE
jgi:hypothetical protein